MSVENYLEQMKKIQEELLNYLNSCTDENECFENLKLALDDLKIYDDQHQIKSVLHLIALISSNHHHVPNFYSKIEKVIQLFKSDITQYLSNSEIFNIFKRNKRIILFLIENKMMIIDEYIFRKITKSKYIKVKYPQYFWPEIREFVAKKKNKESEEIDITPDILDLFDDIMEYSRNKPKLEKKDDDYINFCDDLPDNFEQKRLIGENESQICEFIRNDLVKEFIVYVNKTNYKLTSEIEPSIFETNPYLIQNETQTTLIEYAAFFGSIQIFNYLKHNNVILSSSLWNYAIHGSNADIIHLLEENHVEPAENSYKNCLLESIKCHHNDIAIYFMNNKFRDENEYLDDSFIQSIKKYNFALIQSQLINNSLFPIFCKYDFYPIVDILLKGFNDDINKFPQKTPLYLAIEKENIDICNLLFSCPNIDVNKGYKVSTSKEQGKNKWDKYIEIINEKKSNLFVAIESENLDIIKLLLKHKNINVNNGLTKEIQKNPSNNNKPKILKEQKTPLFLAVEKGNIEVVKLILSCLNSSDNVGYLIEKDEEVKIRKSPLFKAVENSNIEIIKLLLSNEKIEINYINKFLIYSSNPENQINEDELDKYRSMYYKWYDDCVKSFNGNENVEETALGLAVEQNKIEIIQLLLNNEKIDINIPCIYQKPWIFTGCFEGDTEPGIIGKESKHILYVAIENENIEIVKQLIAHANLDINYINENNYIEIRSDSYRGDQKSIKIDFREEKTALCLSIQKGNFEIINLLVANEKTDLNLPMKSKRYWNFRSRANCYDITDSNFDEKKEVIEEKTMLYLAIEEKNIDLIKVLLSTGKIDINHSNNFYRYCTKYPVYFNEYEYYDEEIEREVDSKYEKVNIEKTVLHFAIETQDIEIIKLLLANTKIDANHLYFSSKINKKLGKGHVILRYDNGDGIDRSYDKNDECVNWSQSIESIEKKTPLYLAAEKKNLNICMALLSNNDIDVNIRSTIAFEREINDENINDVDDDDDDDSEEEEEEKDEKEEPKYELAQKIEQKTALYLAVEEKNIDLIKKLLSNERIDVNHLNIFYNFCIKYPTFSSYSKEEQRKIMPKFETIDIEKTVLHFAIETQDIEIIQLLLSDKNIDANFVYCSSEINHELRRRAKIRQSSSCQKMCLIDDSYDENGEYRGSFDFHKENIKYLIQSQSIKRIEKKTPLYLAAEKKNLNVCIALLTNNDIDVNHQSTNVTNVIKDNIECGSFWQSFFPLKNQIEKMEWTFDKKKQEEEEEEKQENEIIKKIEQRTPLHLAVKNEDIEIIQLLSNNQKIDINSKDENGSTPIEYTKNEKIIEILSH